VIDDETGEDLGFGFDIPKASGKLEGMKSEMQAIQQKINLIQSRPGILKQSRINKQMKKLGKLRAKYKEVEGQIKQERAKRRNQRQQAAGLADLGGGRHSGGGRNNQQAPCGLGAWFEAQTMNRTISAAGITSRPWGLVMMSGRAPAGSGRLLNVPMLASGSTSNRTSTTIAAAGVMQNVGTLTSEQVPYSVYKIVGFTANVKRSATGAGTALQAETGVLFCSNLQVKGWPNLFLHDSKQDVDEYDTDHEHLIGLRAFPNVVSPNQATVTVDAIANFVDQVSDDTFGTGVPGAYAG
jgi:hypothetical protein